MKIIIHKESLKRKFDICQLINIIFSAFFGTHKNYLVVKKSIFHYKSIFWGVGWLLKDNPKL